MKHRDTITHVYVDEYDGVKLATHMVRSVIGEALELDVDPVAELLDAFKAKRGIHTLVRTQTRSGDAPVADGAAIRIEGRDYTLHVEGAFAFLMPTSLGDTLG